MDVSGTIDAILGQKGREIFSVSADTTVYAAIELMAQKNVGALVVVENGTLIGLLSERDYTRKITLRGKRSRETPVRTNGRPPAARVGAVELFAPDVLPTERGLALRMSGRVTLR